MKQSELTEWVYKNIYPLNTKEIVDVVNQCLYELDERLKYSDDYATRNINMALIHINELEVEEK